MDQRNTAMSAVADLLGVPNLIARSRNMRFRDETKNEPTSTINEVRILLNKVKSYQNGQVEKKAAKPLNLKVSGI